MPIAWPTTKPCGLTVVNVAVVPLSVAPFGDATSAMPGFELFSTAFAAWHSVNRCVGKLRNARYSRTTSLPTRLCAQVGFAPLQPVQPAFVQPRSQCIDIIWQYFGVPLPSNNAPSVCDVALQSLAPVQLGPATCAGVRRSGLLFGHALPC